MTLVALCFVAVLGITLAGYLAVCSRAMNLSNRTFQSQLSKQLAETGIEEALRAMNKNTLSGTDTNAPLADWTHAGSGTSVAWTLDTANNRATATIAFPTNKFGQGVSGSVKIRVDNYNAGQLGSAPWSATTYRMNEIVGSSGMWYRSLRHGNTNHTPGNLTWWVQSPIPSTWSTNITYKQYDVVNRGGIWYRCYNAPPVGTAPPVPVASSSYWVPIPSMRAWAASTSYAQYDVVAYTDTNNEAGIYRCTTAHTSSGSFSSDSTKWSSDVQTISLSWSSSSTYTRGAIVLYNNGWYYCRQPGSSSTDPATDTNRWAPFLDSTGAAATPTDVAPTTTPATRYLVGDYIYYSAAWRRCITEHSFVSWAADSGKWTATNAVPHVAWAWRYSPSKAHVFNDVVYYSGTWYRCLTGYTSNTSTEYPTHSSRAAYWENAVTGSWAWSSSATYHVGDVVNVSGSFYRCIYPHSNHSPPNAAYWTTDPPKSPDWEAGKSYAANDVVRFNGFWYLSRTGTANLGKNPAFNGTEWALAPRSMGIWDLSKYYTANETVIKNGNWYRCLFPSSGQDISSTSYWSATGHSSYQWNVTTAYSANSYVSYGGVWYKCIAATTANQPSQNPNNKDYWTAQGAPVVYAEGKITLGDGAVSVTQLRAPIAPAPLFPNAVGTTTNLTISAGTGTVDSYDGSVGTMNNDGYNVYTYNSTLDSAGVTSPYWWTNRGYSAVLSSASTLAINGTTAVRGYLSWPSPPSGISTDTTVWGANSSAATKQDPTRINRSPYVPIFDIIDAIEHTEIPATLPGSSLSLGTPGAATASAYFYDGNLDLDGYTLNIDGPVILDINGYLRTQNSGKIVISTTGSAEIHLSGRLRIGASGIDNQTVDPKKLIILGSSSLTTHQYRSTASLSYYGTIYLPYGTLAVGVSSPASSPSIYGAIAAKTVTFDDTANVHYDTSLRNMTLHGVDQPWAVTDWRELEAIEKITMP